MIDLYILWKRSIRERQRREEHRMNVTRNGKVGTLVWACALGWCAGVLGDGAEAAEAR